MADIEDVRDALVTLASAACHVSGVSITGGQITVMPGYVSGPELDRRFAPSGSTPSTQVVVLINPVNGMARQLPMSLSGYQDVSAAAPTITGTVSGRVVTFTGATNAGDVVQVTQGGASYHYVMQAGDTLTSVASAVAAASGGTSSGAALTMPGTAPVAVVVATQGTSVSSVRRQSQIIQADVYAPTPALRRTVGAAIDLAFASTPHITTSDGTQVILVSAGTSFNDMAERANVWRRSGRYSVTFDTYATVAGTTLGQVIMPSAQIASGSVSIGPVPTPSV